jgi:SlyX protein
MPTDAASRHADGPDASRERLEEIEIKITYVEDLLETLDRAVFRQQQQIEQLSQAVAALREQVLAGPAPAGTEPRDEIPPHY